MRATGQAPCAVVCRWAFKGRHYRARVHAWVYACSFLQRMRVPVPNVSGAKRPVNSSVCTACWRTRVLQKTGGFRCFAKGHA